MSVRFRPSAPQNISELELKKVRPAKMTISRKLNILLFLVIFILGTIASTIIYSTLKNIKQVQIVGAALNDLETIYRARTNLNNQTNNLYDYLFSLDKKYKTEFEKSELETTKSIEEWINSHKKTEDKNYHGSHENIRDKYEATLKIIAQTILLIETKEQKKAIVFLEKETDPWIDDIFLEEINRVIEEEIKETQDAYDNLFTSLGLMPWIAQKGKQQIKISKAHLQDYYLLDQSQTNIKKQLRKIVSYLITGDGQKKKDFDELKSDTKIFFREWFKHLQTQKDNIRDSKQEMDKAMEIAKNYYQLIEYSETALLLGEKGMSQDAFKLIKEKIDHLVAEGWISQINVINDKNKEQIAQAHQKLFNYMVSTVVQSLIILILFMATIIIISLRLIRGINYSIGQLKKGTKIIGEGKFEYRIGLISKDELGELSASFDNMAGDLHNLNEELIKKHAQLNRLFVQVEIAKKEWERTLDCTEDMLILLDKDKKVKRCNRSFKEFIGKSYDDIINKNVEDLFLGHEVKVKITSESRHEIFHKTSGKWFLLKTNLFRDIHLGEISGFVVSLHELTTLKLASQELEKAYDDLKNTQAKILQQEKMASIGVLAAGVAHEINNPMSFIYSNLGTMNKYMHSVDDFIQTQLKITASLNSPDIDQIINKKKEETDLDFILSDVKVLIKESLDGAERVRKIVLNLKTFSRVDESEFKMANVNECIESTLNIVWNELKYKTTVKKEYGDFPPTKCYPGALNQVFMNLLVNAAHAIEKKGIITIKTWQEGNFIYITIADTGSGIPEKNLTKIFEPFFTTKEVGKGTGLGLSIVYDIIKNHNGEITVKSEVGKGTDFTIKIPFVE